MTKIAKAVAIGRQRANRRWRPMAMSLLTMVTGLAYAFWWPMVVRHDRFSYWLIPSDTWNTVRDAHYVAWGALPYLYGTGVPLISLPGLPIVLAPFAALAGHLNLTESFGPWFVAHPTSWLIYGPVTLAMSTLPLFGTDAWADELGLGRWQRTLLAAAVMVVAWEVTAYWGHAEDSIAMGGVLYALLALRAERYVSAAWLLGVSACFQPVVLLVLPLMVVQLGYRAALPFLVRAAVLPGGLASVAFAVDSKHAVESLIDQPDFPHMNHPTPWSLISPHLDHQAGGAAPVRLMAIATSLALALLAYRWRRDWSRLIWLGGCMLATRDLFEAVLVPYYFVPALTLALLTAFAWLPLWRALLVTGLATATIVMTNTRGPMWTWWLEAVGLLLATLMVATPLVGAKGEGSGPAGNRGDAGPAESPELRSRAAGRPDDRAQERVLFHSLDPLVPVGPR